MNYIIIHIGEGKRIISRNLYFRKNICNIYIFSILYFGIPFGTILLENKIEK